MLSTAPGCSSVCFSLSWQISHTCIKPSNEPFYLNTSVSSMVCISSMIHAYCFVTTVAGDLVLAEVLLSRCSGFPFLLIQQQW